jgi:hypothetical protein
MMVRLKARILQNCDVYLCGVCCVLCALVRRVRVPGPRSGIRELGSIACHTAPSYFLFV